MPAFNEKIIYYKKNKDDLALNIMYAGITYEDKNFYIKRKDSNMHIFEFVTKGRGYIEYEGNTYKLKENDFFYISTDIDYCYYADKTNPFEKLWFCGDGRLMECIDKAYFNGDKILINNGEYKEIFENIHKILINYGGKKEEYALLSEGFFNLATKVYLNLSQQETNISNENVSTDERAIFIKNYLDENLTKKLELETLCNELFLSKVQLIRLFKKEYNQTPYDYFLEGKMEIAESLILNTTLQIKEIASKVGYDDEYYFSHSFKKYKHISATDLRKSKIRS